MSRRKHPTKAEKDAADLAAAREHQTLKSRVRRRFSRHALKRICEMYELDFPTYYPDLTTWVIDERKQRNNWYFFADRGSDILFVAHLDTVVAHENRMADYAETKAGPVIHSGALDDRLGAYIGLELLPALGINLDILLTCGEEDGQSTAEFFTTDKQYNWVIEFDRKTCDVVMYQYTDAATSALVRECGASVGHGSFSDIAELDHLGVKCFNWGAGYDGVYHSVKGFAYLEDTYKMVAHFMEFYKTHKDTRLPHEKKKYGGTTLYGGHDSGGGYLGYGLGGQGSGRWDARLKRWIYGDEEPDNFGYHGHGFDDNKAKAPEKKTPPKTEHPSVRTFGGKRQHWVGGTGWVDDEEAERQGKVVVLGKEYPSYEAWWNEAHPDEPMIEPTG